MSEHIDIDSIKSRIDDIAKNGIEYIIGLCVFFDSRSDYEYFNIIDTLEPAFGKSIAYKINSQIGEAFKNIHKYASIKIEGEEVWLYEYLKKYILERYSKIILEEVEKRFYQMTEEDKRILSVACAIINAIKDKEYPNLIVKRYEDGLITISSSDFEYFTHIVSLTTDFDISNIRTFFYKYLLGYQSDSASRQHNYYRLKIYPFVDPYIEKLASEVSNYVRVPNKQEIKSKLKEIYRKGDLLDLLKLTVIEWALSSRLESDLEFAVHFFGIPYKQIIEVIMVEGIISNGFINPLIYDNVKETINVLYKEALKELMDIFKSIFEEKGYTSLCGRECCTFTRSSEKSIHLCCLPWPKRYYLSGAEEISIKAVVIRGLPSQLLFQHLKKYEGVEKFVWLFLDVENRRIIVPIDVERKEICAELEKILSKYFTIEPFDLEKFKGQPSSSGIIPRR
jgi:hypothetical protein